MQSTINTSINYYAYDQDGMYAGIVHGYTDPLNPDWISAPGHSTDVHPPYCQPGEVAVWRGDHWETILDRRGKVYYDTLTREAHQITRIDDIIDPAWTDIPPTDPDAEWTGAEWILPLDIAKTRKIVAIRAEADAELAQIQSGYSQSEIISWTKQESGARDLTANPDAVTPDAEFVRAMASSRGIPVADLVSKIMGNLSPYAETMAYVLGNQQRREDRVKTAETLADLDVI